MIEVRRRPKESTGSLLRRFTRSVQQSRVLLRARKIRFYAPERSKRERRLSALRRLELREENERLRKLGKLEEEHSWRSR